MNQIKGDFEFKTVYTESSITFVHKSSLQLLSIADVVNSIYSFEHRQAKYTDEDYMHNWKAFIALCLEAVNSYKFYCSNFAGGSISNLPRSFMDYDESMRHVGCYSFKTQVPKVWYEVLSEAYSYIESREFATINAKDILPRPLRLRMILNLSQFAYFAMHCALVCELDAGFAYVFALLQANESKDAPTLGVIQTLYSLAFPYKKIDWFLFAPSLENRLLFIPAPEFGLNRKLALHPYTFSFLIGRLSISHELSSQMMDFTDNLREPLHIDRQVESVHHALMAMYTKKEPRLCILTGGIGSGRKTTLRYLTQKERLPLLMIDLNRGDLGGEQSFDLILEELLFHALVNGTKLCFALKDPVSDTRIQKVYGLVKKYRFGIFILTDSTRYPTVQDGYFVSCINYPPLDLEKSADFWRLFSQDYEYSSDINWNQIAARYTLTPGQIENALQSADEISKSQGKPISEEMISSAILFENTGRLSAIADRIDVVYSWNDLMLDETPKNMLMEACNRIKYRHIVEIEWDGKFAYGNGISILLYGPPGTGKTMSAQVIANELGLPLYRINLSHIVSKYIGETSKNINMIFEEAKRSNIILFFDEADALFAKRTEVKNSNDRHANSESSYLLQKIEEYSGITILATNLAHSFDEAFRRRISYMINIRMPSATQRLEIWKRCIPSKAPLAEDVDLKVLAEADSLDFSGSVIRAAALRAAYLAATENTSISMNHLAKAVRSELQKQGKSEPHFLSSYSK